MIFLKAEYRDDGFIVATADGGTITIPDDMANADRRALAESGVPIKKYTAPTEAELLDAERQGMKCSRLQGRLVLGETTCDMLDVMAADPETPWAMKQTILHAIEWSRTSQSMDELGYLLGYEPEQMDELFRQAMTVSV